MRNRVGCGSSGGGGPPDYYARSAASDFSDEQPNAIRFAHFLTRKYLCRLRCTLARLPLLRRAPRSLARLFVLVTLLRHAARARAVVVVVLLLLVLLPRLLPHAMRTLCRLRILTQPRAPLRTHLA